MKALLLALQHPPDVPDVGDTSPLEGLARRRLGIVDAASQSVAAMAPTAGVATMPALVAAAAGPGTALSVLLATFLVALISSVISQFARRLAVTGSLYSYAAQAFSPYPALLTGAALLIGYGFIAMFALAGAGIFLVDLVLSFVPGKGPAALQVLIGTAVVAVLCSLVMRRGVRVSSRVMLAIECASVLLVLVLVGVLLLRQGLPGAEVFPVGGMTPLGIAGGTVLALMAFVGFESATVLGAETRAPLRTIPRALLWTVLATGLFFMLIAYSQLAGFDWQDQVLAGSSAPFVALATRAELPGVMAGLDAAIVLSFTACALASITALTRVLFTMGREGVLPQWLGELHPKSGTPVRAISVVLPVAAAVPAMFLLAGLTPWEVMNALITAAAAGFVTSYIFLCVALPLFLSRIGEVTASPLAIAGLTGMLLTAALTVYLHGTFVNGQGAGCILFLTVMGSASFWFLLRDRSGAAPGPGPGLYDVPTTRNLLGAQGDD